MGILIDELEYINGRGLSIIIPNETIDEYEFQNLYHNNQDITGTIKFPNLISVKDYGLSYTFEGCGELTNVEFPNLKSVSTFGLSFTFGFCTRLTNVSFPSLTSVEESGLNNTFWYSRNITEIHFRADAKSVIEAQASYLSKFGAPNATVYFDL